MARNTVVARGRWFEADRALRAEARRRSESHETLLARLAGRLGRRVVAWLAREAHAMVGARLVAAAAHLALTRAHVERHVVRRALLALAIVRRVEAWPTEAAARSRRVGLETAAAARALAGTE